MNSPLHVSKFQPFSALFHGRGNNNVAPEVPDISSFDMDGKDEEDTNLADDSWSGPQVEVEVITFCKECDRDFVDANALTDHLRHSARHKKPLCSICSRQFRSKVDLMAVNEFCHSTPIASDQFPCSTKIPLLMRKRILTAPSQNVRSSSKHHPQLPSTSNQAAMLASIVMM